MSVLKNKKVMIGGGIALSAVIIIAVVILLLNREETYRIIKVFEVDGTARVERDNVKDLDPYADMLLISGDRVTLDKGELTLNADEDKFIYMEENTELILNATGTKQNSKTKIELIRGAITNEIQHKLTGDSSYEINTPNSTMSVMGTIFYVKVYEENGVKYTDVVVFDGNVATRLIYKDGTVEEKVVPVSKGSAVTIYEDTKETDYLTDPAPIAFEELPVDVLHQLQDLIKEGNDVSITNEEIEQILKSIEGSADGKEGALEDGENSEEGEGASDSQDGVGTASDDALAADEEEAETAENADDTQNPEDGDAAGENSDEQSQDGDSGNTPAATAAPTTVPTATPTPTQAQETANQNNSSDSSNGQCTVTFMYNGSVFGTQSVQKGSKASEPSLSPSDSGDWDYDFSKTVEKDITVEWK